MRIHSRHWECMRHLVQQQFKVLAASIARQEAVAAMKLRREALGAAATSSGEGLGDGECECEEEEEAEEEADGDEPMSGDEEDAAAAAHSARAWKKARTASGAGPSRSS